MSDHMHTPLWRTKGGVVLCGFLIIAGFYLLTEHTAHVLGALPFLLLAACPLMHLFMHHGHGGHGGHGGDNAPERRLPDDRSQGGVS
jgi:Protein of unknown function (DUF2933)